MSFKISIRVADRATQRLQRVVAAGERGIYRAINKVAGPAFTRSKKEIGEQVNLTKKYLNDKTRIKLVKANSTKNYAEIIARRRPTRLSTYKAKQLKAKKKGAKGDLTRKIPKGAVAAGVSVQVKTGGAVKKMRRAFLVPLKRGTGLPGTQGMGVFIRTGRGRKAIKHLYGPSVDQVFQTVREDIRPEVQRQLALTLRKQMQYEFRKG